MKYQSQTGIYRAVLTLQLLLWWLQIVAYLTIILLHKVDSVLWKLVKCLSSCHLVSCKKYSQHECCCLYCQFSWSSAKKSTGSIIIIWTGLIYAFWSTWILASEKTFYINLVLEIGNVTLKVQLFFWISEILCPAKQPIKIFCKCCKYFLYVSKHVKAQSTFESCVPFWLGNITLVCSLLKASSMLKSLMKEYLVAQCAVFPQD